MCVENLEMNNSLKWVLFIKISGQITSNTLWKRGEVFFLRIWRIFLFLRALVNIPIQTPIIPPWPLLRKMIISQLELGPPGHFELGFFASRIRRSEMECSALGFSYVRCKPRNEQLAQMGSFHQSKRSDNKQYAVEARWGIFFENLTYFFYSWGRS